MYKHTAAQFALNNKINNKKDKCIVVIARQDHLADFS